MLVILFMQTTSLLPRKKLIISNFRKEHTVANNR